MILRLYLGEEDEGREYWLKDIKEMGREPSNSELSSALNILGTKKTYRHSGLRT